MDARQAYIAKYKAAYGRAPVLSSAPGPRKPIALTGGPAVVMYTPPPAKPVRPVRPMPPIRVFPQPAPPIDHRPSDPRHGHRRSPIPLGPPVFVPPTTDKPAPVIQPAPLPVQPAPGGLTCPSWGWMVKTNPDGSETVVRCAIGQPAPAGLHGFDEVWNQVSSTMAGTLGPNWLLYVGGAAAAYFLLFKKRR